jgi:glucose/arabinose dehydrogenase
MEHMMQATRGLAILIAVALAVSALAVPAGAASSGVKLSQVLSGYTRPVLVTHAGGGSRTIFIVEQTGKIKRATFRNGSWRKLGTFLDLSTKVTDPRKAGNNERGLLGLAFHPNYQQNGRFYVNYTRRGSADAKGDTVIAEYRRSTSSKANPSSRRVLMVVNQPYQNHNGGHLAFGPDGLLYIGLGDGGSGGDPRGNGQKLSTRLGKLLRINPLDPDGAGPKRYKAPSSNPRVGKSGLNDIWAWGLRNPWRFSFDRANGNLWIGDVGQVKREEIDRSRSNSSGRNAGKGKNYGWNRCEGKRQYPDTSQACTFGTRPVHDYAHGTGRCSVTGGYVHRGPGAAAWRGLYVAGDYCGRLFVLASDGKVKLSKVTGKHIASFGEDAAGRIFATDVISGKIFIVKFVGPRP